MVKNDSIEELRRILREGFGRELTFKEAFDLGLNIVAFFDHLARLDHKDKTTSYQKDSISAIIQT